VPFPLLKAVRPDYGRQKQDRAWDEPSGVSASRPRFGRHDRSVVLCYLPAAGLKGT